MAKKTGRPNEPELNKDDADQTPVDQVTSGSDAAQPVPPHEEVQDAVPPRVDDADTEAERVWNPPPEETPDTVQATGTPDSVEEAETVDAARPDVPRDEQAGDTPAETADADTAAVPDEDALVETYAEAAADTAETDQAATEPETAPEAETPSAPEAEPIPAAAPQPAEKEVIVKKQGLLGGVIGGAVAAAIGFGAAQIVPEGWPVGTSSELESAVATQSERISALSSDLVDIGAAMSDDSAVAGLRAELEALRADAAAAQAAAGNAQQAISEAGAALTARMEALEADLTDRIVTLEKAPIEQAADAAVAGAVQAYEAEVSALRDETRSRFDALAADLQARLGQGNAAIVEALEANQRLQAERAEREAAARDAETDAIRAQAFADLRVALQTGAPFADVLDALPDAPAPLPSLAADGVVAPSELAEAFPPLARRALQVALRETSDGNVQERVLGFLRTQLGVRSLTPREGDDPDAVLSRMEAAVAAGDYDAAVADAARLPEPARAVLSDWLSSVETRSAALAAADALGADLNTN